MELPGATEAGPGTAEVRFTVPRQAAGGVARVEVDDAVLSDGSQPLFACAVANAAGYAVVDGLPLTPAADPADGVVDVAVAFGVSITVGIAFGIVPAYRAARQDPVVCLRYE